MTSLRPERMNTETGIESFFLGIDIGASAVKAVLLDGAGGVAARTVRDSGFDFSTAAELCLKELYAHVPGGRRKIAYTLATGYGRKNVGFADEARTEIACHGRGCYHHFPGAITIVDIGAQDNKVIVLDSHGTREHFRMNRKCAAGTGAFLEEIALQLKIPLTELNNLATKSEKGVALGSYCTVFAKTEILARIREGVGVEDLARGAYDSVIRRVIEMDPLRGIVALTGGVVGHNPITADILSSYIGRKVLVPPFPQYTGALGAALFALDGFRPERGGET